MRLSSRGRYAAAAMAYLSHCHEEGRPIPLAKVAAEQNLSVAYLEQLFARLKKASLVRSINGPGGGYLLTRHPSLISLTQVIEGVGDTLAWRLDDRTADGRFWDEISRRIRHVFDQVSLEEAEKWLAPAGNNAC